MTAQWFRLSAEALGIGRDIGPSALLVFTAMAAHANTQGLAWPSAARLAELTGLSRRRVGQLLADLVAAGWLEQQASEAGRGKVGRGVTYALKGAQPVAHLSAKKGAHSSAQVSKKGAHSGARKVRTLVRAEPDAPLYKNSSREQEVRCAHADRLLAAWGEAAVRSQLVTRCAALTPKRQAALRQRLQESVDGSPWIDVAVRLIGQLPFAWQSRRLDIDWLLRPDTVTKFAEGVYSDAEGSAAAPVYQDFTHTWRDEQ